ncbi:MAG: hypothetical protein V4456_08010 [Bacteroidota bacterium]
MKPFIVSLLVVCTAFTASAQVKLSDKDFGNLIALSQLYSHDNMFNKAGTAKSADSLRAPVLNHIIDALEAEGRADTSVISKRFLQRPDNVELKLWYVIRGVHYNNIDTVKARRRPAQQVANDILAKEIDERILLNNYYSMALGSGIAFLFNQADLSKYNFDLDSYGLKNQTEKAILFFRLVDPLIRGRFMVLSYMKKYDKLEAVIKRLPTFNGKPYYYYNDLNFPDFDEENLYKKESFKKFNINFLMQSELIQLNTCALTNKKEEGRAIYENSILSKPEYFDYTEGKEMLQKFYDARKK